MPAPLRVDAHAGVVDRHVRAGLLHGVERRRHQLRPRALEQHVAAGHGDGERIGAGLDPVGQDAVPGAAEPADAFDHQRRGAGAGDLGAHLDEAIGEVGDLRLARGIVDDGRALGENRRHQGRMGAADGHFGKA